MDIGRRLATDGRHDEVRGRLLLCPHTDLESHSLRFRIRHATPYENLATATSNKAGEL